MLEFSNSIDQHCYQSPSRYWNGPDDQEALLPRSDSAITRQRCGVGGLPATASTGALATATGVLQRQTGIRTPVPRNKGSGLPSPRRGDDTYNPGTHSKRRRFIPVPNALAEHMSRRRLLQGLIYLQHSSDPGPLVSELQMPSSTAGITGIQSQQSSSRSGTGSAVTINHPTDSPICATGTGSAHSQIGTPQKGRTSTPLNQTASCDLEQKPTGGSPKTGTGRSPSGMPQ